jgi:hypothetical protein
MILTVIIAYFGRSLPFLDWDYEGINLNGKKAKSARVQQVG